MPEPTKHFNFVQTSLAGSPIETVMPAAGKPVGTIAFDLTSLGFYQVCQTAGNAHVWRSLGGGTTTGWSKYVVSAQATPVAPYSTIQSAVAAAVADGHDATHPAVVLIMPGAYTASVNVPPGITLCGLVGAAGPTTTYKPVALAGDIVVTLTSGADRVGLFNLAVAGGLTVTGSAAGAVACGDCSFVPGSGSALVIGTADARVELSRCVLTSLDGTPSIRSTGALATIVVRESTVGADATVTAVELVNDVVTVIDTDVLGVLVISNAGVYTAQRGTWKSTGPIIGTMTTGGSSPEIKVDGTAIDGKAAITFTGSAGGTVTLTRPVAVGGAIVVDAALTTRWNELDNNPGMVRVGSFWGPAASDFQLVWGDHNVLAYLADVGTIHCTLPFLDEVEDGYKVVVTKVHGAGTLNVVPAQLADLVNGTATTFNVATSTVFIADRVGSSWWTTTA